MEALSHGVTELDGANSSSERVNETLAALESAKEAYAQELSKLKTLNDSFSKQLDQTKDASPRRSKKQLPESYIRLENLTKERESLVEELRQEKTRYKELEKELEQVHTEKLEAQMCLSVLNDTIKTALDSENLRLEGNQCIISDQEALTWKLKETSKSYVAPFNTQIRELESMRSNVGQEEVAFMLFNKLCIRGLWVLLELFLFCHAMLCFILRTMKENYSSTPT
ncbi:hypothetical protein KP509_36G060600 [Ceratopteris richardii]|uniref:Uncharacterized protein n=1 Tax=Ceratopteris richardii TaxID=49495 RepID=A0A8T2QDG1_CERRI|nr:hypothetical protein KP509_36G060600 [Ceratopteris richardii]